MKLFIVLALTTVALATPVVQPIAMPEAPLPEIEVMQYVPMVEPVAIKPLFVPQEVIESLRLAEQNPSDAKAVFEAMEQAGEEVIHVVEYAMYEHDDDVAQEEVVAPAAEEIPADAVKFVDVAAPAAEDIPVDAVNFVDDAALAAEESPAEAVNFVDFAEEVVPVHFVDNAENIDAEASDVVGDVSAVKFVDVAPVVDFDEASAVKVVEVAPVAADDSPRYPGKVYDNILWR